MRLPHTRAFRSCDRSKVFHAPFERAGVGEFARSDWRGARPLARIDHWLTEKRNVEDVILVARKSSSIGVNCPQSRLEFIQNARNFLWLISGVDREARAVNPSFRLE